MSAQGPPREVIAVRNPKLDELHERLTRSLRGYVGLYEAGSVTAGDPWVPGRSDRDIAIVYTGGIYDADERVIRECLGTIGFGSLYLFQLIARSRFLLCHHDHDISMKFRGQTLYGPDLIALKESPTPELAAHLARTGFERLRGQLRLCLINGESWSVARLRDRLYEHFKVVLMFMAARVYAETGSYPRRRADVAAASGFPELAEVAVAIRRIDELDRDALLATTFRARQVIFRALDGWAAEPPSGGQSP